ncbi:Acyl-CoA N-acyltransferases superfamily protein [Perilla frutescens var. hirtella]|uniref:Acyl-CoA N-acyltransferases superfamily protein n=1 Tax=Perilla frutescens var. hirtella TaxID=608512 RepID=A0AAD4JHT7_PERFH|nr:Acyl-CoA N-acyltransferases superfamily protein [Perilla frutescens var. hirtella]
MAHLHHSLSTVVKGSRQELLLRCGGMKKFHNMSLTNQRRRFKNNTRLVCCSSSTSTASADQQVNLAGDQKLDSIINEDDDKQQLGYLVRDVNWQVRRMFETEEEMKQVANVQAEAFHEPVFLFDDLFFDFFKAEVLSGLLYRLRNSPPGRYACLVAEPRNDLQESKKELAGVVDVTVLREDSVLQHLLGEEEYLYVSGIAVLNKFRRQKVATTLLKACDTLSAIWGFEYLVLRAYEDDNGARKLYSNAGYRVVSADPPWTTSWIGRRRRVLMVKQANME